MAAKLEIVPEETQEDAKIDILGFSRDELAADLSEQFGFESFRTRQLISWLYRQRSQSFDEMTDISKSARELLKSRYRISRPEQVTVQHSVDGTKKYLFRLADGLQVESVLIAQAKRHTLCVSSQVGCAIACAFCQTGRMGLTRHLTTAEIVGQVLAVRDVADDEFYNIVFMGMGEPFHNLDNVIRAVNLLNDPLGCDFSNRKITVSTSGLVPAIKKFGESGAGANLAISLNATTDEVRTQLIPINKRWPLKVLLETLREYPLKNNRKITIEYVMLGGVNDSDADLKRLPGLLQGIPSKINLIPYNDNAGLGFSAPPKDRVYRWQQSLLDLGLNSTIRWSKGLDIDAACGQLVTQSTRANIRGKKNESTVNELTVEG